MTTAAQRTLRKAQRETLERALDTFLRIENLPAPQKEYKFHPTQNWRFDRAWPDLMLAAECEGGTWARGRHVRGSGFEADCEKYNEAAILGWRVLRFTGRMIQDGRAVEQIKRAMNDTR